MKKFEIRGRCTVIRCCPSQRLANCMVAVWGVPVTIQEAIMKRWHEEFPRTYREWKKHHRNHIYSEIDRGGKLNKDPFQVECVCDEQKGRFRKIDAWDCGNTQCYICHSDKFPKRDLTYREWESILRLKEGIDELWD